MQCAHLPITGTEASETTVVATARLDRQGNNEQKFVLEKTVSAGIRDGAVSSWRAADRVGAGGSSDAAGARYLHICNCYGCQAKLPLPLRPCCLRILCRRLLAIAAHSRRRGARFNPEVG